VQAEGASLKQQVTTLTDQVSRTQAEAQAAQAEVADLRQRLDRITQLESDNGAVSVGVLWWWDDTEGPACQAGLHPSALLGVLPKVNSAPIKTVLFRHAWWHQPAYFWVGCVAG
jgi:hypothetical protein